MKLSKSLVAGSLAGSLLSVIVSAVHAIELPDGFVDEPVIGGLDGSITTFDLTAPERIFIGEKSGVVRVVDGGVLQEEPFIDISTIVNDRVDRGMLSIALHPQFPEQPYVYVLYTYDPPELAANNPDSPAGLDGNGNRVSRLARYTADESENFNRALPGSEQIILGTNSTFEQIGNPEEVFDTLTPSCGTVDNPTEDCLPIDEVTHTIGALRFAADGTLYVTNGDGASFRSREEITQLTYDPDSLRGKVLRIDADTGQGLADNPFYDGNPSSNRSRVISLGLRNPFSMAIHPVSGLAYVGEVGQEAWEEINVGFGANFGWPCYEGGPETNLRQALFSELEFCQDLFQSAEAIEAPLISWAHDGLGNAAIIGDFYFGQVFPEEFSGTLFYGDFIRGWLRYADVSDPANVVTRDFATDMLPMTEMRSGDDGALYYASVTTGEIRRIRFDSSLVSVNENSNSSNVLVGSMSYWLLIAWILIGVRRRIFSQR